MQQAAAPDATSCCFQADNGRTRLLSIWGSTIPGDGGVEGGVLSRLFIWVSEGIVYLHYYDLCTTNESADAGC